MGVSTYSEPQKVKPAPVVTKLPVALSEKEVSASVEDELTTLSVGSQAITLDSLELSDLKELLKAI